MLMLLIPFYMPFPEIDSALSALNLGSETLHFSRLQWINSDLILPTVKELMEFPLSGEEYSKKIIGALKGSREDLIITLSSDLEINLGEIHCRINSIDDLIASINKAGMLREEAFERLTQRDKLILLSKLPGRWENEEDSTDNWLRNVLLERYSLEFDTTNINEDSVMAVFEKVNMKKLMESGFLLYKIAEAVPAVIENMPDDSLPRMVETRYGRMVIGTRGSDEYDGNASFILEPGGDDRYKNSCGAIGIIASECKGLSLIVDIRGNDTYISDEIISTASAFTGCAVILDKEGDDYYNCSHYSIGSGYMGFALLIDNEGNDVYKGGIFSIGVANFGLGMLLDSKGDDFYSTSCYGEGFGSTYGFGLLADYEGNDVYYAGGRYYHTPLQPNSYQSLSQGFGMGIRPDWGGGIGFLYDGEGNDFYNGDIYAQGVSYWCSAGFLIDEDGQDRYMATEYAQGAGIHLSYGYLADLCGDDHYFSRFGPSLGEGHDFSCGIFIDSSGNDWYSVSGGLGIGLNNSFGLFCDISGDDIYNITEDLGIGDVNHGREFCGTGIFLDLSGKDQYPEGRGADNLSWVNNDYGIGIDKRSGIVGEGIPQRLVPNFQDMNIKEIFELASEWGVGDNQDRVKEARKHLGKRGRVALDYIFENKLDTEDGLERRAIEYALKENKDSLLPYLASNIHNPSKTSRKNVFLLIGKLEFTSLSDSLLIALTRAENRNILRYIVYALGKVRETKAVNELIGYLDEDEPLKINSVKALGEIGDTIAITALLDELNSPYVTVRSSVEKSLIHFDTLLYPYIKKRIKGDFLPELLLLGSKSVFKDSSNYRRKVKRLLFRYIEDSNWKKREYAARGLLILGGDDVKERFKLLSESEPNPVVRGILKQGQ